MASNVIDITLASTYDGSGVKDAERANARLSEIVTKSAKSVEAHNERQQQAEEIAKALAREQEKLAAIMDKTSEEYLKTARNVEVLKDAANKLSAEGEQAGISMNDAIGAAQGNVGALIKIVQRVVPALKAVSAAGLMAFGAIIATVKVLIDLGKALYNLFDSIFHLTPKDPLADSVNAMAALADRAKDLDARMKDARQNSEELTKSFNAEVSAINKLTQAQLDFNRAQEIALANSKEERDAINARYDDAKAQNDDDAQRKLMERRGSDLRDERARLQEELREYRRLQKEADKIYDDTSAKAAEYLDAAGGFTGAAGAAVRGIFSKVGLADKESEDSRYARSATDAATKALIARKEYARKAEEIEKKLAENRQQLDVYGTEKEAFETQVKANELKREQAEKDRLEAVAAKEEDERKKAEAERVKEAERVAEAERKAAEKAEAERLKAVEAERRERERMEADLHRRRIDDVRAEIAEAQKAESALSATASGAQSEFAKAFAMYRDKDLAARTVQEERDYAADYKQLGKDAARYGGKWRIDELASLMAAGDTQGQAAKLEEWRKSSRFTPEVEAMVRASAADQTRTTAEAELRKIAANTEGLAQKLDNLLAMK